MVTITFSEERIDYLIDLFGWDIGEYGVNYQFIMDDDELVMATDGRPIRVMDLAGVVQDDDGNPVPLRDDFNSIVEHAKTRREEQ